MPIGTPEFVDAFVRSKADDIQQDVQKLRIIQDPKIHYDLLSFCQHTRRGLGDTYNTLPVHVLEWCRTIVELPHHEGGLAITPLQASGMAAFYSAAFYMAAFYKSSRLASITSSCF